MSALVAQWDSHPTGDPEVAGSILLVRQPYFIEIDHEIFSTVILSLAMIQERHLSVSGKRITHSAQVLIILTLLAYIANG